MTAEDCLRDAISWATQVKLAEEAAAFAQRWKPKTVLQRIEELRRTRERFERARQLAIAAGALAPAAAIHIQRDHDGEPVREIAPQLRHNVRHGTISRF